MSTPTGTHPPVTRLGRTVPGWALRGVLAVATAGVAVLLVADGTPIGLVALLAGVGALGVALPASAAAAVLIGGAGLAVAAAGGDPLRPEVIALVPTCHAVHLLAALAAPIPPGARIQPAALRRPVLRWLAVQAPVGALLGLAAVPVRVDPTVLQVAGVGAVFVLLGIVVIGVRAPGG